MACPSTSCSSALLNGPILARSNLRRLLCLLPTATPRPRQAIRRLPESVYPLFYLRLFPFHAEVLINDGFMDNLAIACCGVGGQEVGGELTREWDGNWSLMGNGKITYWYEQRRHDFPAGIPVTHPFLGANTGARVSE